VPVGGYVSAVQRGASRELLEASRRLASGGPTTLSPEALQAHLDARERVLARQQAEALAEPGEPRQAAQEEPQDPKGEVAVEYARPEPPAPAEASRPPTEPARDPGRCVLVLDTETTGLGPTARLVELAVAKVQLPGGEILAEWSTLVDPGIPIPADATRIHGITNEMVRGQPGARPVLRRLAGILQRTPRLVAHNAAYDVGVLRNEARRVGVTLPKGVTTWCSQRFAKATLPGEKSYALGALAARLGLRVEGAHRALADVRTTAQLVVACVELAEGRGIESLVKGGVL
jgi:DNA polymerase III epsilon subunit-like protein